MKKKLIPDDLFGEDASRSARPAKAKTTPKRSKRTSRKTAASKPAKKTAPAAARVKPKKKKAAPKNKPASKSAPAPKGRPKKNRPRKTKAPRTPETDKKAPPKRPERLDCPFCNEQLPEKAHICPHCYIPLIDCPYCARRAGGLENPRMATEQRFNRILKQFTLFSPALPSMPIQPILDCSECSSRIIICESCHLALKHTARSCPSCGGEVRRTKLLINPLTIIETILNRPDALKGVQRLIDMLISQQSKF